MIDEIWMIDETRWDEKAGLRRHAVRSQVIDALSARDNGDWGVWGHFRGPLSNPNPR